MKKIYLLAVAIATVFFGSFTTSKALEPSLALGGELSYNHPLQDFGDYLAKSGVGIERISASEIGINLFNHAVGNYSIVLIYPNRTTTLSALVVR